MDNRIRPENKDDNNKPVATDTTEIVRRHLEDKNHKITEEEIRNVRIGVDNDEPVTTGAEAEARFVEGDREEDKNEEGDLPDDHPTTPWDVIK